MCIVYVLCLLCVYANEMFVACRVCVSDLFLVLDVRGKCDVPVLLLGEGT